MWRVLVAVAYLIILTVPAEAQDGSFEQASTAFIQRYIQEWAGPASTALTFMDQLYPDQIDFYGKAVTHEELMNLKRKFVMRWPKRILNLRPDSIRAVCNMNHLCTVQAVFDWHYTSQERQAISSGSSSLKLVLQDGMTILAENGTIISAGTHTPPDLVQRKLIMLKVAQPVLPPDIPAVPTAEASLSRNMQSLQQGESHQLEHFSPQRDSIAALRHAYTAHATDKDWIAGWLSQKRDFSSQATYVGFTEDQAVPGTAGALRIVGFTSAAGTIACINPNNASSLKVGQTVNIHGTITVFIEDVMYLGLCSIQPG